MKILHSVFIIAICFIANGLANGQTAKPNAADMLSHFWKMAVSDENKKDYDAALRQLQLFQQTGGNPFLAALRIGWVDYLKQDYKRAAENYNAAASLQPTALNPLLGLLSVAQAQADSAQTRSAAERILRIDPLNDRAQMAEAAFQFQQKNYRESLNDYRRVLQIYPDDLDAISGEAWSLYDLGYAQQAASDFQILLSVNPDYPYAKQGLSLANGQSANRQLNLQPAQNQ